MVGGHSVDNFKAVFFDDRVCEHFFRNSFELFLRFIAAPAIEIQDKELPLADIFHGAVAQSGEGVLDRLSLRIEYRALWHHPDVCFHDLSIPSPLTASCATPSDDRPERMFEAHFDDAEKLLFLQSHACGVGILVAERRVKHGRIVSREYDWYPVP